MDAWTGALTSGLLTDDAVGWITEAAAFDLIFRPCTGTGASDLAIMTGGGGGVAGLGVGTCRGAEGVRTAADREGPDGGAGAGTVRDC